MIDTDTAVISSPFNEMMRRRTKAAALRIINLFKHLPRTAEAGILGKQLIRSGTSVAANFRAACRGRSPAEWFSKLCICVEEADETIFWLEMLGDAGIISKPRLQQLEQEYLEIVAILATARKKAQK
jgi:four helix bundle protein